jgi:hypothetical protein
MRPPCASSRGSHPRTSPRSPSRSTRTASRSTPRRNVGAIRRARESVSFAARTRGARPEAPERSDASCGDRRRRQVSRALRNARAARRRRRAAALLKVEKIMGIQNVRATARESASGGPGCSARSLRSDGEFPNSKQSGKKSQTEFSHGLSRHQIFPAAILCGVAAGAAPAGAADYKTSAGRAPDPSLQVAPVRLGTRSLPAHYPVSLRAHLQVRVTVAGTASATRERALRGFFIARRRLRFARRRADICAMRQPPACAAG